MKTWTKEETEILFKNYNKVTNNDLHKLIPNKTPVAIYKKAYKAGLRKSKEIEFLNRSIAHSGENCNFWNGGVTIATKGYRQIRKPEHPRANKIGYVMEHILVWEKHTNTVVPDGCCVHHLNGIKDDNRIENLCLMEFGAHTAYHHLGKKRNRETCEKISKARRRNYD